jgi:hypothetical protein
MIPGYSVTYDRETICGDPGYSYRVFCGPRLVFEGWSRGSKRDAEADVREGIRARSLVVEAL